MATLEPGETLAELLARLESLEKRLAGGAGAPPAPAAARGAPAGGPAGGVRAAGPGAGRPAGSPAAPAPATAPPGPAPRREAPAAPGPGRYRASAAGAGAPGVATAVADPALERDARVDACWRATLEAVNRRKRMLGAFLEESRFLGVAGDFLVVAMDDLHRAVVEEKENRGLLLAEARGPFGRAFGLRCVPLAEAPPALEPGATEVDVEPMIHRAIAWFDGDVIERTERSERTPG
jgi:hypothetical protein